MLLSDFFFFWYDSTTQDKPFDIDFLLVVCLNLDLQSFRGMGSALGISEKSLNSGGSGAVRD